MKYKIIFFSLLSLGLMAINSCQSPLSENKVGKLSLIKAQIEIFQSLTDQKSNDISVFLYDEDGKPIRNKSIKLKLNGADLPYKERQELYYTITSKYSGSDIPVQQIYNFEITLSDGKSYFLGSIKPLIENRESNIICDEKGDFNKDLVVSWKNLEDINEISVTKGVLLATSTKTQQNHIDEPVIIKKIGSSGKYIISKSEYISPKSTINIVGIKFNALKFGQVNPELLAGSEIKIFGYIDKRVFFDEESK